MIFDKIPLLCFLILIAVLLLRVLNLRKRGISLFSKRKDKITRIRFLLPVFGLVFLLWLFEIVKTALGSSILILPAILTTEIFECFILRFIGSGLLLISIVLWIITLQHFKTSLRFGLDKNNPGKLVTTGIFSISRNPFFLSLDLYFLGVAIILPSWFFIGFTLSAFIGIHFSILNEERFLKEVYGNEYRAYKHKTRRYF